MTKSLKLALGVSLTALIFASAPTYAKDAEKKDEAKWDVSNPPGEKHDVKIDTKTGIWMSLDVSPDGKTIAFDLLGDIYTMPIEGGEATARPRRS